MSDNKYRLVTRSDFDGLVCAVLLNELNMIDEIKFVHPKDMQDGKVEISERDITTNLPFVPGVHLAFDHHLSETFRNPGERPNHIIYADAPSAARVVYEHFGGKSRFPAPFTEMIIAVERATRRISPDRKSSTRRTGCCSTTSWIRAPGWAASASFASATTS